MDIQHRINFKCWQSSSLFGREFISCWLNIILMLASKLQ